jgi:hypothetical protein
MGERSYAEQMSQPGAGCLVEGTDGNYIWHPAAIQVALDADTEIAALKAERDELLTRRNTEADRFCEWRGIDPAHVCRKCGGAGRRSYGSTAAWRGGAAGQMFTVGVCDACWGSGDTARKGANLRLMESQFAALEAENERLRWALERINASASLGSDIQAIAARALLGEGEKR